LIIEVDLVTNLDWNFGVRAGYGIAIVNGVWVKFSSGDGVA